jgi:hypothetical protein
VQRFVTQLLKLHSLGTLTDRELLNFGRHISFQDQKYPALLSLLDFLGRKYGLALLLGPVALSPKIAAELYRQNRAFRGLLSFILVQRGRQSDRSGDILDELPAEAFETENDDSVATKRVIEVLRAMGGRYNHLRPEDLAIVVLECAQKRLPQVLTLISNSKHVPEHISVGLLIFFCEQYRRVSDPQLGRVIRLLKVKLDARRSRLSDAGVCETLSLPVPLKSEIH